jgi:hypothetical protein
MQSNCHAVSNNATITSGGSTAAAILPSVARMRVFIAVCLRGNGTIFATADVFEAEGMLAEMSDLAKGMFIA